MTTFKQTMLRLIAITALSGGLILTAPPVAIASGGSVPITCASDDLTCGSDGGVWQSRVVSENAPPALTIPECNGVRACNDYFGKQMKSCFDKPGQQNFVIIIEKDASGHILSWSHECS